MGRVRPCKLSLKHRQEDIELWKRAAKQRHITVTELIERAMRSYLGLAPTGPVTLGVDIEVMVEGQGYTGQVELRRLAPSNKRRKVSKGPSVSSPACAPGASSAVGASDMAIVSTAVYCPRCGRGHSAVRCPQCGTASVQRG